MCQVRVRLESVRPTSGRRPLGGRNGPCLPRTRGRPLAPRPCARWGGAERGSPRPTGASPRGPPPARRQRAHARTLGPAPRAPRDPLLRGARTRQSVPRRRLTPQPYRSRMLARAYFQVVDAIAAACSEAQLSALGDRIALAEMHPLERRALARQLGASARRGRSSSRSRGFRCLTPVPGRPNAPSLYGDRPRLRVACERARLAG